VNKGHFSYSVSSFILILKSSANDPVVGYLDDMTLGGQTNVIAAVVELVLSWLGVRFNDKKSRPIDVPNCLHLYVSAI